MASGGAATETSLKELLISYLGVCAFATMCTDYKALRIVIALGNIAPARCGLVTRSPRNQAPISGGLRQISC